MSYLKSFEFNTLKKSHGKGTFHTQTDRQTHGHRDYKTNLAQRAELVKNQLKIQGKLNFIAEKMQIYIFFFIFLHILTSFYLKVQIKSLKDFKCG